MTSQSLLTAAVERPERSLELLFQPEVDLATGGIVAMEALLRLHVQDLGVLAPPEFLREAEQAGAGDRIGDWVLRTAAAEAAGWQDLRGPTRQLRINLSTGQLRDAGFAGRVAAVVAERGLRPGALGVEVSEGTLRELGADLGPVLGELRAAGVAVAVDDTSFYATLAVIETLPVDVVKLGHRYVRDVDVAEDVRNLVEVLGRAHDRGLVVVAEGVQTWGEAARLVELGCDRAHGWLYASAQRSDKARWLLQQGTGWRGDVVTGA